MPTDPLSWEIKADFVSDERQKYYKKRANLNEGLFGILRNIHKVEKLNRNGLKNAEKELTLHLKPITYKKYIRN